mmetsp:Transcript_22510/g.56899  ORF Transcript_22510/g.56899 Transcript_22510/m.56899 type:complete len:234 (+) Transcript_22510:1596-2297(+)
MWRSRNPASVLLKRPLLRRTSTIRSNRSGPSQSSKTSTTSLLLSKYSTSFTMWGWSNAINAFTSFSNISQSASSTDFGIRFAARITPVALCWHLKTAPKPPSPSCPFFASKLYLSSNFNEDSRMKRPRSSVRDTLVPLETDLLTAGAETFAGVDVWSWADVITSQSTRDCCSREASFWVAQRSVAASVPADAKISQGRCGLWSWDNQNLREKLEEELGVGSLRRSSRVQLRSS